MRSISIIFILQFNVFILFGQNTEGYDKIGKFESGRAKVQVNGLHGIKISA